MIRFAPAFALLSVTLGCAGSEPPAQSAPPPAESPPAAAAPAATPATSSAATTDGWEGEGEAKGTAAAASEPKPASGASKQAEETRTVDVIAKVIKEHRQEIREQCYEPARKDLPSLQGDMVIHLVLDPTGKVKVAELNQERSTLKSAAVVNCATGMLKRIAFPASSRGMETVVNYPFNFMPGGPAQR